MQTTFWPDKHVYSQQDDHTHMISQEQLEMFSIFKHIDILAPTEQITNGHADSVQLTPIQDGKNGVSYELDVFSLIVN